MRKRISLKTRRRGLSPESFREHYEQWHVPLGLSFVDRFQWRRYVRNYVLDVLGEPVGFDAYTEFWVPDDADDEALARFIASPEFRVLDEDDRRFLDVEARFSCEVVALPFALDGSSGAAAADAPSGDASRSEAVKTALLWSSGASSPTDVLEATRRITAPVVDRLVDATLEQVVDPSPTAPFDTLLTLWLAGGAWLTGEEASEVDLDAMPAVPWSLLTVDPVETPADRLSGGGAAGAEVETDSGPKSERTPT